MGDSRLVTFTFAEDLDITQPGTISFPLYRTCGITSTLGAKLSYADACQLTKTGEICGGLTTRQSNLLLRAPQITYTVDTDAFSWQFSVRNAGNLTATNVLVTNTLPFGVHYRDEILHGDVEQVVR